MIHSTPTTAELAAFPILRHLSASALEELLKSAFIVSLKKGESFYKMAETTDQLFLLMEGRVKLLQHGHQGKELLKDLVTPGEFFGEGFLLEEPQRKDSAEAMDSRTKAISVSASVFRQLTERDLVLALQVESLIYQRIRRIEQRVESLIFKNSKARILAFLQETTRLRCNPLTDECLLSPFLTHHDIARLTDTSRQTVTVVLNELRKGNLIELRRKGIYIPSHTRLMGRLETALSA